MRAAPLVGIVLGCSGGQTPASDGPAATTDADRVPITCADDSAFEPNETPASAFITPVASLRSDIAIAGLSICDAADADTFAVDLTAPGQTLVATAELEVLPPLSLQIIDANGVPLAISEGAELRQLRAVLANQPPGRVFVQITGGSTPNNYALSIEVSP